MQGGKACVSTVDPCFNEGENSSRSEAAGARLDKALSHRCVSVSVYLASDVKDIIDIKMIKCAGCFIYFELLLLCQSSKLGFVGTSAISDRQLTCWVFMTVKLCGFSCYGPHRIECYLTL